MRDPGAPLRASPLNSPGPLSTWSKAIWSCQTCGGGGNIGNPDNADLRVSPSLPPWPPLDPCPSPQHFYPASVSSQERSRWGPVPGKGLGDSGG